ncbi:hypothetical protein [Streptomyces laurentii]|uniref:hypothetical protein n=1 Tax=Streptomyces laurentii TaxID=39478 RepID=UPI00367AF9DF
MAKADAANADGDRPGRRRDGNRPDDGERTRLAGVLAIVLGLVCGAVCFASFAYQIPSAVSRYADYRAAAPCPAADTGTDTGTGTGTEAVAGTTAPRPAGELEDCLRTLTFTVDRTVVDRTPRTRRYQATLSGGSWHGTVVFAEPGPVLDRLRPGERVDGTLWRGTIMALGTEEAWQGTLDEPRDESRVSTGIATGLGLLAVLCLRSGPRWWSRPDRHRPPAALVRSAMVTGFAVFLGCLALGALAQALDLSRWIVPALAVPATLLPVRLLGQGRPESEPGGASSAPAGI